jgi:hypothetical protein
MRFVLLGTIVATNPTILCSFVMGHLFFVDDKTCVSAFDVAYFLKQVIKLVCKAVLPNGLLGVRFDEMAILKDIAGDVINDGSNEVD